MNKTKLLDRLEFHEWDDFEVKEARKSDSMILEGYTIDDIDSETITIYKKYLSIRRTGNPFLQMNKTRFLKKLGCLTTNKHSPGEQDELTMAGL